jgi:atypical dual specificity phosphatase
MYGEWLAMKHSLQYTRLPDTFLAFDILEIPTMRFYSFSRLLELLQGTSIRSVPIIAHKISMTRKELLQMVNKESNFYDGPVEGIYIRLDNKEYLIDRAKIVRPDFTSGNEEWDKGRLTANVIVH